MLQTIIFLKDARDEGPLISKLRELENFKPLKKTENCGVFVLHNGGQKEFACPVF